MTTASVFFCDDKIDPHRSDGMADVQVPVGLWGKSRNDLTLDATFSQVIIDDLLYKIPT
jgi:hypothetical protein